MRFISAVAIILVSLTLAAPLAAQPRNRAGRAEVAPLNEFPALSFRVAFDEQQITLRRTSYELPRRGQRAMPAYLGAAETILHMVPGTRSERISLEPAKADQQSARYRSAEAETICTASRLSPAILLTSDVERIQLKAPDAGKSLKYAALPLGGGIRTIRCDAFQSVPALAEPWLLLWFGNNTSHGGYPGVIDVDDEHDGAGFARVAHPTTPLDLPLLIRLEHPPTSIRTQGDSVQLEFSDAVGKLALMPLFGGCIVDTRDSEEWPKVLPNEVIAAAQRWSRWLRDYPIEAHHSWEIDSDTGDVLITNAFRWSCFDDAWNTPATKAAPLPPMLGLALPGHGLVDILVGGKSAKVVDAQFMDTPGAMYFVEGTDRYAYRVKDLENHLTIPSRDQHVPPGAGEAREKLQAHIEKMLNAGHLAPLLYIHGGIGGTRPGYFYWGRFAELAQAMDQAWPFLSESVRGRASKYLRDEFRKNPPFTFDASKLQNGHSRAPYEIPWQDFGRDLTPALTRERARRQATPFGEFYGLEAYVRLTGDLDAGPSYRDTARQSLTDLMTRQDWALHGPVRPHDNRLEFFIGGSWYERNDQAALNNWLAGALGLARLADRYGWDDIARDARYLFAMLAVARVGQARYVQQMHERGLVLGPTSEDWRTLVHIDRRCAIVLRGDIKPVVVEDQELPPFLDLTPEVGRLLQQNASEACRVYLQHLDRALPLWYLSEAPKQSASEQRLCPLLHKSGNVLAQYWILGKRGDEFRRYVDTTRFIGDLDYIQNVSALIDSYRD